VANAAAQNKAVILAGNLITWIVSLEVLNRVLVDKGNDSYYLQTADHVFRRQAFASFKEFFVDVGCEGRQAAVVIAQIIAQVIIVVDLGRVVALVGCDNLIDPSIDFIPGWFSHNFRLLVSFALAALSKLSHEIARILSNVLQAPAKHFVYSFEIVTASLQRDL
jgi:hypothetical protein